LWRLGSAMEAAGKDRIEGVPTVKIRPYGLRGARGRGSGTWVTGGESPCLRPVHRSKSMLFPQTSGCHGSENFYAGSFTMDFEMDSARNRRRVSLEGGYCDIISQTFHRHGRHKFVTIHGFFVSSASSVMGSISSIRQPEPGMGGFETIGLEDSLFGALRGAEGLEPDVSEAASSRTNGRNEDLHPFPERNLDVAFEFESAFPSQFEVAPTRQGRPYETVANEALPNNSFSVGMPGQGIGFSDGLGTSPHVPSASQETSFNSDRFGPGNTNKMFHFSHILERNPNVPSASQEPSFSSNAPTKQRKFNSSAFKPILTNDYFNFSGSLENANVAPVSPETSFYSDFNSDNTNGVFDMDFSGNLRTSPNAPSASQETSFSNNFALNSTPLSQQPSFSQKSTPYTPPSQDTHLSNTSFLPPPTPKTPSPSSPSLATSPSSNSPHSCSICSATFKRPGDVKRHEKKHFPAQIAYHCWEVGCERNGMKGFYRRDKLRDHEKTVHGF
jgi:hypothetical protein